MEEIQLKNICDLENGYAFKSSDYVEISNTLNCRMSNIRPNGSFDILYNAKYLPDEFADKYKECVLNDGDLIIAMTDMAGDPKILGVPTVVDTQGYVLLLNQRVGKLRLIKNGINVDYLKLALQCPKVRNYLKRFAGGGVQLNVSKKDILSVPVKICSEDEQRHISTLFKKILKIESYLEKKMQLLDELIKARFVEMFGSIHDGRFDMKTLLEIVNDDKNSIKRGPFGGALKKEDFVEDGYLVYEQRHAIHNDFEYAKYYINQEKYEDMIGFKVIPGDLIISCSGVTLGRIAEVPEGAKEGIINQALLKLSLNPHIMMNIFFIQQFRGEEIQNILFGFSRGSGIPNMPSMSEVKAVKFICPPLELQKEYCDFVNQIDKSKVASDNQFKNIAILLAICSIIDTNLNGNMGRTPYDN